MARKSLYLAERSKKITDFIMTYRNDHDYGPSLTEIGKHIGVRSTSLVIYYINYLEKNGYIIRDKKISRSIRVLRDFKA